MLLKGLVKRFADINAAEIFDKNSSIASQLTEYQKKDVKQAQKN